MSVDEFRTLLARGATAHEFGPLLVHDAVFETLGIRREGVEAVATQLGTSRYSQLSWDWLAGRNLVLAGSPRPGSADRGIVISLVVRNGLIARVSQQGMPPASPATTSVRLDEAMRERFDLALERRHPMTLAYVDARGRPHLSLRGSLRSYGDSALCLWVRNRAGGLVTAIEKNAHVAVLYRDESVRSTYQISGRARLAEDEVTREAVYASIPAVERDHDFARLGAAVIIEIDRLEGFAGMGLQGPIGQVCMVRPS